MRGTEAEHERLSRSLLLTHGEGELVPECHFFPLFTLRLDFDLSRRGGGLDALWNGRDRGRLSDTGALALQTRYEHHQLDGLRGG